MDRHKILYKLILSIDLGGTNIRYALVRTGGEVVYFEIINIIDSKVNENELKNIIYEKIISILESQSNLLGISFAVPWVVSHNRLVPTFATNFSREFSLDSIIKKLKFKGYNISIINDVNAALLGEKWKGKLFNCTNGLYINIGTGLSMGILINNKIHYGACGLAGEIAFCISSTDELSSTIDYDALLENQISGRAFLEFSQDENYDAKIQEAVNVLIMHIINFCYILNPEKIVFGGGVIDNNSSILSQIKHTVYSKIPKELCPQIEKSELEHVVLLGGAKYIIENLDEEKNEKNSFK